MEIGQRLKQVRKLRGFTQDSLAEAIGVSRGVITNIEHEKTEPQPLVVRAICDVLHVQENWLMNGVEPMELKESQQLISEIYHAAMQLNEAEQNYILDMIHTYHKHRGSLKKE